MTEHNEWDLGSGLGLDGATVTVTDMEFGFNANIGADVVCANFTFVDDEGEEHEQSFSVGKGFDPSRDGTELVSDRPKNVNKNTNFGILIGSAVELLDDPSELGGSPRLADTWIGTKWDMGTIAIERKNPSTGETKSKDTFVFTAYHGRDGEADGGEEEAKPAKAAAKKATGAKKSTAGAVAASKGSDIPDGVDADLWEQLVTLAGSFEDHDDFVEAALEIEEVDGNRAAQKAVLGTKPGSVWAARAAA